MMRMCNVYMLATASVELRLRHLLVTESLAVLTPNCASTRRLQQQQRFLFLYASACSKLLLLRAGNVEQLKAKP